MKKDKRTNNDLQSTTQKAKDLATRIPLNTEGELRCPGRIDIPCSTGGIRRVTLVTNPVINDKGPGSAYGYEINTLCICCFHSTFHSCPTCRIRRVTRVRIR